MKTKIRFLLLFLLVNTSIGIYKAHGQFVPCQIDLTVFETGENLTSNFSPEVTDYVINFPELPLSARAFILGVTTLGSTVPQLYVDGLPVDPDDKWQTSEVTVVTYVYTLTNQPMVFDIEIGNMTYKITVIPPEFYLILLSLKKENSYEELIPNFSPEVTNYTVELPSSQVCGELLSLKLTSIGNPNTAVQLRVNGELSDQLFEDCYVNYFFTMETQPMLLELELGSGNVYKITVIPSSPHFSQLSIVTRISDEELIKDFSKDITTYYAKLSSTEPLPNLLVLRAEANDTYNDIQFMINDEIYEYLPCRMESKFLIESLPTSIKLLLDNEKVYEVVVDRNHLSQLSLEATSYGELIPNFSPEVTNYTVELPSYQANETPLRLQAAAGPNEPIQFRINGELSEGTYPNGFLYYVFTIGSQPIILELLHEEKVYKITVIPYGAYLSQLSLKCKNHELLKNFNNETYSYSVLVADSLSSPTNQMIPVNWEVSFPKYMTVQLNGQPLDSCIIENTIQKCHGTQIINKDSLTTLKFKVIYKGDTATYNVQLKVDVKVPATKLTIQGKDGTIWDLDPSPEVLSEYDQSACYRNNEGIWEKLLYLNINQPIDSVKFNVEAPSGYVITKPEGWSQIKYGANEFDVQTSRGIHKMNYHIVVDRGPLINLDVAYTYNYSGMPQEITITEQERRYGTNSDTVIYVVPASATKIKIAANNVPSYVIVNNASGLGIFDLNSSNMQFLVTGTDSRKNITRNIVIRVLKDVVSLNNFNVTVYKKGQPNTGVPICIFPQFSPETDTYMCILPESEFEERTLRISTQYQNTDQVEINGFRIGNVQHDERNAFIKAFPDTSFHNLTNHQYSTQNSLRTDIFSVDSEVSAHQVYVDSLGGYLNYKIEKQLDGYYFITVKNGNICKTYNLIVVSVNHTKIVNNQKIETTPDANRYMGLLNPLNGELRFTTTGVYNNVSYKYINYTDSESEYADLFSTLSSNTSKIRLWYYGGGGAMVVVGTGASYYFFKRWLSRGGGNQGDTETLINHSMNGSGATGMNVAGAGAGSGMTTIITGSSGYGYFVAGLAGAGLAGVGLAGVVGCAVNFCKADEECYSEWQSKWKYSKNSNIEIKNLDDVATYHNLGDYNTVHVYPWSSNSDATLNVNGVGNEFIIHNTGSNHVTLHFKRPGLCVLPSGEESISEKEKNNRLAYRNTHNGTDMKLQVIDGANANTVKVENDLHVNMEIKGNNNNVYSEKKFLVDLYGQNNTVACDSEDNEIRCNLNHNTISVSGSHIGIFGDATQVTLNNAENNTIDLLGYGEKGTLTDTLNQYKDKTITRTVNLQGNSQNNLIKGVGYNSDNKPAGGYNWTLNCNINSAPDKNKISISNWKTVSIIINNGKPYKISREEGAYELILNCKKAGIF